MKKLDPILIFICLLISACTEKPFKDAWGAKELAEARVAEVQELYNKKDFVGIYQNASNLFKEEHSQEEIEKMFFKISEEFGSLKTTVNLDWEVNASNRDNTYATIIQNSVFEKKEVKEIFNFLIHDGAAVLESYELEWVDDEKFK